MGKLAVLAGVGGWFLERRHADGRAAEADSKREEAEAQRKQAEEKLSAREEELENERSEREREGTEAEDRERELRSEAQKRDKELSQERSLRQRVQHAHQAEREWTRELRSQVLRLHREHGALAHTGDVRAMVLQVALELVEANKGILLSRKDRDGDGMLDFVCHRGFENDPTESAVAQEFATRAMKHEDTIREDDSSKVRAEGRTAADEEIENLLAIPVYIQDDFEGVIVCANRDGGFEELDDEVLLSLGDHAGSVLENGRLHGELRTSYIATVRMMADAIEVKDPSLRLHSDEVASYVGAVATRLDIEPRRREELIIASLLHDVGKIGISERILLKPGALTPEERSAIELHSRIGFRLVEQVPSLDPIGPAVLHHHERFDGDGYPGGLTGEEIPLEARVICVADCFSAMTSDRPYRTALDPEEACLELERCAGTQFDPRVVQLFVEEVRASPPSERSPDGLAAALDDPEIRVRRRPGEAMLGQGPVGSTDNLTMLYSHRYMQEAAAAHAQRSEVQHRPFAVVMLELSTLVELNGRDGYATGDGVIQEAAAAMQRAASRCSGTACRYSGRRLALLVPETDVVGGEALARELELDLDSRSTEAATGVAAWQDGETGTEVITRARLALAVQKVGGDPTAPPSR